MNPNTSRFADVAHQALTFDKTEEDSKLVLELLDADWVQRLRSLRQTGNTNLVYMYAEHSRFGHSLGVAYLAILLMKNLSRNQNKIVQKYKKAVAAAALLHDIGHSAPGSHLAERVWAKDGSYKHEKITVNIIKEDPQIREVLENSEAGLTDLVCQILNCDSSLPAWTHEIISGGGWNADRGNWAIVDSAMCSVSYGRYNVLALLDSFCISEDAHLVLHENRLDALTHFYVARDSMYRQVYQHRVLQAADALTANVVKRLRDIGEKEFEALNIFADESMKTALSADDFLVDVPISTVFQMTESWWNYHLERWTKSNDKVLVDLALRITRRKLFKTIRLVDDQSESKALIEKAEKTCSELGYDPKYYLSLIGESDKHRESYETPPSVILDDGSIASAADVEPLIEKIVSRAERGRKWIAVPTDVKKELGIFR